MKTSFLPIKRMLLLLLTLLLVLPSLLTPASAVRERQSRVIRVGYPIQRGLTMRDEHGTLSGYTYDYLMEISQYTGWRYEFVFVDGSLNEQLSQMMELLANGEIDILGSMSYDESSLDRFSYPGYCYGINYSALFVPEDSQLRESSLYNIDHLRVGVYHRRGLANQKLEQFAQMNNLNLEQVISTSSEEREQHLADGKVDAILSTDLAMADRKDMFPIVHFSPSPFYFATTKGNTEVIRQLDYALSTIDQVNPDFSVQLYNTYFTQAATAISLSEEEKTYVQSSPPLNVVLYDNKPPFQYIDKQTGNPTGITVEILEKIAQTSGLTFRYLPVSTYEEYIHLVSSGEVDIGADALINYQDALDTSSSLSLPWASLPITFVCKEGKNRPEEGVAAAPYFLKNTFPADKNIEFYNTVEECLDAVEQGRADYSYAGEFCTQYLFNARSFSDLTMLYQADLPTQKLCFAVCDTGDLQLLTILNKSISLLSQEDVNEIIYRRTYQQAPTMSLFFKANRIALTILCVGTLALAALFFLTVKIRQQQRIAFENKRHQAISNLANEYFYEYILRDDTLLLSEKCAAYFACQPKMENFSRALDQIPPEERDSIWQFGEEIIRGEETSRELSCQMPDGSRQWFKVISTTISNRRQQLYAVGKIINIQEEKSKQLRLEQLATLDGLTGVYNAAAVKVQIRETLAQQAGQVPCALLILDMDNFKQINDTFGHYNGDAILVQGARLIANAFPDGVVGRLGGDEFVALASQFSLEELEAQCGRLCRIMGRKTTDLLGTVFTWSIGIAVAQAGDNYDTLYQKADAALYATKSRSKNGYTFYRNAGDAPIESK